MAYSHGLLAFAIPEREKFAQFFVGVPGAKETLMGAALMGAGLWGCVEQQNDG